MNVTTQSKGKVQTWSQLVQIPLLQMKLVEMLRFISVQWLVLLQRNILALLGIAGMAAVKLLLLKPEPALRLGHGGK